MKIVKFLLFIAILSLVAIFHLIVNVPNPLDQQYDNFIQEIMEEKGLSSEDEVLNQYPEWRTIKSQIEAIKQMNYEFQQVCQNPMPPQKEQSIELSKQIQEREAMERNVIFKMNQMIGREYRLVLH